MQTIRLLRGPVLAEIQRAGFVLETGLEFFAASQRPRDRPRSSACTWSATGAGEAGHVPQNEMRLFVVPR